MKNKFLIMFFAFSFLLSPKVGFASAAMQLSVGNISVYYAEQDKHIAELAAKTVNRQQQHLYEQYALEQNPMIIYIAQDASQYRQYSGSSSPLWSMGLAFNDRMLVKSPSFSHQTLTAFRKTLIHETVHLAVTSYDLPVWFNEGLAQYEAGQFSITQKTLLSRAAWSDRFIPFRDIEYLIQMPAAKAKLAYAQSVAAVDYMIDYFGVELVAKSLYLIKKYEHFSTGFRNAFLMSPEAFEKKWQENSKKHYRIYLLLDTGSIFWIPLTVLFVLGYVLTRYRRKKLLKRWEQEERENNLLSNKGDIIVKNDVDI